MLGWLRGDSAASRVLTGLSGSTWSLPLALRHGRALLPRWAIIAYVVFFSAYRWWVAQQGSGQPSLLDAGQLLLPWGVSLLALFAARAADTRRQRLAWHFLASAYFISGCGEAVSAWQRYASAGPVAPPSPSDVASLAFYPLALTALTLLMPRRAGTYRNLALLLDSLLFTIGPAGLCWFAVVQPALLTARDPLAALANVVWPLGDLVVAFVLVASFTRWDLSRVPWSLLYVLSAFAIQVVADGLGAVLTVHWRLDPMAPLDPLYAASYGLTALAALSRLQAVQGEPTLDLSWARTVRLLLPYLALPAAGLLIGLKLANGLDEDTPQVLLVVAAIVILVLVRQLLTVLENNKLSGRLANVSHELERRVQERTEELARSTRELAVLNRMATELSRCLTTEEVASIGLRLACEALQVRTGAVWLLNAESRPELLAHQGLDEATYRVLSDLPRHAPVLARLLSSVTPAKLHAEGVFVGPAAVAWDFGARPCLIVVPLLSRRMALGSIMLSGRAEGGCEESPAALVQAIGAELGVALENSRRYESARELAYRDLLTGLLNRRGLDELLVRELRRAERAESPLSLALIDVDGFKLVNDRLGHAAGDYVLRAVARMLSDGCRESDTVARLGGDEFVILAPNTTAAGAAVMAERVRLQISGQPEEYAGQEIRIRLSFGIATYPDEAREPKALLERADANLYRSKEAGGNTVTSSAPLPAPAKPALATFRPRRQARAGSVTARPLVPLGDGNPGREAAS